MDKGMLRGLGFTYERNKNNSRHKSVFIQHLGDQYCYVTSMCDIIAFYATAKQALILLLIWLDLGFISSVQMRPSVGFFNNGLSI